MWRRERARSARAATVTIQEPRRQVAVIVPVDLRLVGSSVREIIYSVITDLRDRFDAFRSRRRTQSRFLRANQAIALVLLIGTLLGGGVLAATAVTSSDSETPYVAQSNAARVSSFSRTEVVTETVNRLGVVTETDKSQGGPVRLLRQDPGRTVQDLVTLPARTVRETHTVTTREVVTVTAIQPVTVTVFETVTCKPKDC
jgi:hypothetical protein